MRADYRPDIDGLRAIAVLSVMLFHFGWSGFSGGYVGVDIFFVISGYLITKLIAEEHATTGTVRFGQFYLRRVRRLFPALACTLLFSAVAALLIFSPEHLKRFSRELMVSLLSLSNIFFFSLTGYFDVSKEFKALLHTWSLSVEEQFYLVWPLLLFWALRSGPRVLLIGLAAIGGATLILSELWPDRSAAFFLTPFRAFEFILGATLVWIGRPQSAGPLALEALLLLGLAMMGYAITAFTLETRHPGLLTLIPTIGAALVIYSGRAHYMGLLLRNPFSVWVGKISYSLYLVHWPLLIFYGYTTLDPLSTAERMGLLAASFSLAAMMYYGVEQPLRPFRLVPGGNRVFVRGVAITGFAGLLFGGAVVLGEGWSWRLHPAAARLLASAHRQIDLKDECKYQVSGITAALQAKFDACSAKVGKAVLVFGDSHGRDLFNALAHSSERLHVIGVTRGGCRPSQPQPECYHDELDAFVEKNKASLAGLVFTQKGSYLLAEHKHLPIDRRGIETVVDYLKSLAKHRLPVLWVGPQWEPHYETDKFVATRSPVAEGPDYFRDALVQIKDVDAGIAAALQNARSGISYVSKIAILGPLTGGTFIIDGEYSYSDTDHWSAKGEEVFGAQLLAGDARLRDLFSPDN